QNAAATQDLLRAYVPPDGMLQVVLQGGQSDETVTGGNHQELIDQETQFYQQEVTEVRSVEGTPFAFVAVPVIWTDGEVASLQLTESMEAEAETMELLRIVLLVVSLIAIVPLFISARILSNLITNPITSLIQTMNEIRGSGQFQRITPPKQSKDELYQMTEAFNQMIDQLASNYERQEQFVSNASHELKTPLTVIESYSSLLKRRGKNDEALFDESVEAIHSEAERMRELTQQLLLLAKQEEHWNMEWQHHSLTGILQSTVNAFEKAYQRDVRFEVNDEIELITDEQKLKQLLYIFMDNARKYSDDSIDVRVDQVGDKARVVITDSGIGISRDHLQKVFDRFYQVDEARTRSSGGFGLGLSLAKELAQVLGAEVQLDSEVEKGTKATILLPLSQ
ncbi:cell wall metabolism sensor histidine kinase WalK, partial [Halobacillus sp. BBL2006]|uniref:sensor histidine kinase n=1 Tax=Halobacillus sp. BBL2006 TaxID=1543706 RepID=UPI000542A5F7